MLQQPNIFTVMDGTAIEETDFLCHKIIVNTSLIYTNRSKNRLDGII